MSTSQNIRAQMAQLAAEAERVEAEERAAQERALGRNPLDGDASELPDATEIFAALADLAHSQAQTTHLRNDPCGLQWQRLSNALRGEAPPVAPTPTPPPSPANTQAAQDIEFHRAQLAGAHQRQDAGAIAWHSRELKKLGAAVPG